MKRIFHILSLAQVLLPASAISTYAGNTGENTEAGSEEYTSIELYNPREVDAKNEIVEIPLNKISDTGKSFYYIKDANGEEIPSQRTHDNKIIFKCDVDSKKSTVFKLLIDSVPHTYDTTVSGKIYPQRADDLAWENEKGGYRIYGPSTRRKGEKAYGHDLFFKHTQKRLILPTLYKNATSKENRLKLDSIKRVSPEEAKRFSRSISFHYDHGLGMDCYAVGPTLGAGASAVLFKDSLIPSWCYEKCEILDNGPLRFSCRIDYYPIKLDENVTIQETKILTLDSDDYLNRCIVRYRNLPDNSIIVTGFPIRDASEVYSDSTLSILAYSDPTQGKDNGKAMLGLIKKNSTNSIVNKNKHVLSATQLKADEALEYYWGFSWNREFPGEFSQWKNYLHEFQRKLQQPLEVRIRNK